MGLRACPFLISKKMCVNPNQNTLSQSSNGQVYWCENCKHFSVIFNTSCMLFKRADYKSFIDLLESLGEEDFKYVIGREHKVLLKNNFSTVGIALSVDEALELVDLMAEGILIYEANRLIST
tara:strand:+ start:43 stop:408 length:366 start_codon:yes stop_codon:yes gene_type:complete